MSSFFNAVKSESTKLLTLRSTLAYFILLGGAIGGPVFLYLALSDQNENIDFSIVGSGGKIALMICVIFGASSTAGEIDTKMHAQAFLTQNSRWNWLAARGVAGTIFVVFTLALALALTTLMVVIWPGARFSPERPETIWTLLVGAAAFTLIAMGLAAVLRSRVAAVGLPLVWMLVVEPLILTGGQRFAVLQKIYDVMPSHAVDDMQMWFISKDLGIPMEGLHAPGFYLAVLAAWVVAMLVLGFYRNARADVR